MSTNTMVPLHYTMVLTLWINTDCSIIAFMICFWYNLYISCFLALHVLMSIRWRPYDVLWKWRVFSQ